MKKLLLPILLLMVTFSAFADVTYNVTVPAGTKACYIAGAMNGWSQQEMTKLTETTYTLTIVGATTDQKYKYCSGPNWGYVEKQANCTSDIADRTYAASDVVACWAAVYVPAAPKVDVTVKVKTPAAWAETRIHYWGDQNSSWPGDIMTKDGNWFVKTFSQINTISIIFNNNAGSQTADILNVTTSTCYQVNADNSYSVIPCTNDTPRVTYNVKVPAGTKKCYIAGEMTSWGQQEMTKLTDSTYTITIDNANTAQGYKYCSGPAWDYEELQADCITQTTNRTYAANDVVACWKAVYNPITTINNEKYNNNYRIVNQKGSVNIESDVDSDISVYTIQGIELCKNNNVTSLKINNLKPGIYLIRIDDRLIKTIIQ